MGLWERSSALWPSQDKRDYFHKSSHFHAYFPLCPDLCNCGMHMCGKEPLENAFLLFVKGLTCLGNWLVRRLYPGGPAGIPAGGRGWTPGPGLFCSVLCRLWKVR